MNETVHIAAALCRLAELGEPAILATVVRVEGSAYRRPGARMLVTPGGERIGCVSGGCLERDARLRGARLAVDDAVVVMYDARHGEQTPWDLALGCNGKVELLIERLSPGRAGVLGQFLASVQGQRRPSVSATLIEAPEQLGLRPGLRVLCEPGGAIVNVCEAGLLLEAVPELGERLAAAQRTAPIEMETDQGPVAVLVEAIEPPPRLVVFGAGWDAVPVVGASKTLGWHVTLVDHRRGFAMQEPFGQADARVVGRAADTLASGRITRQTAVVIMTHDYAADLEILETLVGTAAGYVGVLGPRSRTERLLAELRERGVMTSPEFEAVLHAPVGLALGGETPAEVALAIVAEILAWRTGSSAGALRDHRGPIHRACAQTGDGAGVGVTDGALA